MTTAGALHPGVSALSLAGCLSGWEWAEGSSGRAGVGLESDALTGNGAVDHSGLKIPAGAVLEQEIPKTMAADSPSVSEAEGVPQLIGRDLNMMHDDTTCPEDPGWNTGVLSSSGLQRRGMNARCLSGVGADRSVAEVMTGVKGQAYATTPRRPPRRPTQLQILSFTQ
ncbi:hypothetical protein Micbo1qcDRAFT_174379 [Microdochium bolleyi]|uniref:Uncharacterized protein n=1 Tax=Microdochium bolleyi TaxID=196109 RepID=A0A136J829_9PEZI|nr:hypothetical protein Micbo1qcDRAFT_174379 [Microdochium bolleyi]